MFPFSQSFAFLATFLLAVTQATSLQKRALATVYFSCAKFKTAALTFDDGPYQYIKQISDALTAAGAKGTFFFNGNNYDCIYSSQSISRVKYAYNAGHMIGQHTWSHADLTQLSTAQIQDSMYRMEEAFSRILGIRPAFMRPPFGSYNDNVRSVSGSRGQALAMWDWDTGDADGNTTAQSEAVYQDAVNSGARNMLFLEHETLPTTASTLVPFAINLLQTHGYQLVTLAECLGVQPYQAIGVPQQQTSAWTCDGSPGPGGACSGSQCKSGTPTLSGTSGVPTPTSTPPPTRSNQVIHPNGNTGKCLAAASNTNNAAVEIENCVPGAASQLWTLKGFNLQIFGNKCLDDTSGNTANGQKMQIYTCNTGNPNQQWVASGNTIQLEGTSKCLDNTGGSTTNGNLVQIWDCTGGPNQRWQIVDGGSVAVTTTTSTTTTTPGGPTPTGQVIHPGKSSSYCLTASSNVNNAAVVVEPCDSSASQSWKVSGGTLIAFGNKCLDVTNGSTANGIKMQIYTCFSGNMNQQFTITADKRIVWTGKGECLDLTDGLVSPGNQVQMWRCTTGNTNQVWNIV